MKTPLLYLALAGLGIGLTACGGEVSEAASTIGDGIDNVVDSEVPTVDGAISDAFATEPTAGANYGAGVAANVQPLAYDELLTRMEASDSLATTVRGEVVEVCQKKGCWMTLRAPGGESADVTVRFKDYGFFMPKTLSGSEVVVAGQARRTVTSVDDLRHYAEDAGKSAAEIAAITEPKEELEFIATGVRVL